MTSGDAPVTIEDAATSSNTPPINTKLDKKLTPNQSNGPKYANQAREPSISTDNYVYRNLCAKQYLEDHPDATHKEFEAYWASDTVDKNVSIQYTLVTFGDLCEIASYGRSNRRNSTKEN